jgi:hypothetical protein
MNSLKYVGFLAMSLTVTAPSFAGKLFNEINDSTTIATYRNIFVAEIEAGNVDSDLPLQNFKSKDFEITLLRYYVDHGSCNVEMNVKKNYADGSGPTLRYEVGQLTDDVSYGQNCSDLTSADGSHYRGKGLYSRENDDIGIMADAVYQDPKRNPLP